MGYSIDGNETNQPAPDSVGSDEVIDESLTGDDIQDGSLTEDDFAPGTVPTTAADIDNVPAGNIAATDVQAAINELDAEKSAVGHTHVEADITDLQDYALDTDLQNHITDAEDAHDASAISTVDAGGYYVDDDVESNLQEVGADVDAAQADATQGIADAAAAQADATQALSDAATAQTTADDHIADATDAHAASAITNTPAGDIAATTVQGAIDELDSEKASTVHTHVEADITDLQAYALDADLTAHINDAVDAHDASAISNVPAGNIAATDIQSAINELDTEKAASVHTHVAADVTDFASASQLLINATPLNDLTAPDGTLNFNFQDVDDMGSLDIHDNGLNSFVIYENDDSLGASRRIAMSGATGSIIFGPTSVFMTQIRSGNVMKFQYSGGATQAAVESGQFGALEKLFVGIDNVGDVTPKFDVDASGTNAIMSFGSGSAAPDWNMTRTGAGVVALGATHKLQQNAAPTVGDDLVNKTYADTKLALSGGTMTGNLLMNERYVEGNQSAANVATFRQKVTGDAELRSFIYADGTIHWGDGTNPVDVTLGRVAADTIALGSGDKIQQSTAPSVGNDLTNKTYVDASHATFTAFESAESEAVSTTTSSTFQNKVTLTTATLVNGAKYKVQAFASYGCDKSGTPIEIQLDVTGTAISKTRAKLLSPGHNNAANRLNCYSETFILTASAAATAQIDLDFREPAGADTAHIEDAIVTIERIG